MALIDQVVCEVADDRDLINVIVRVVDADGVEGVGESWWGIADRTEPARAAGPMVSVVNDLLAPKLIGREADDIEVLWAELVDWGTRYGDQGIFTMGISGVDLALWDLRGQRTETSVCDLLGGAQFETLPAYASLPWFRSTEIVLRETQRALDAGFDAVKLHESDPEITAAVRSEFGDDLIVIVDVNGTFDHDEAVAVGHRLSELGVLWFEEPVRPMRDHTAIAAVGEALDIDLAGGENEYTIDDIRRLLTIGSVRWIQPELTKIGGLTPAMAIADLVHENQRALCPHNFRLGPSCAASIHWAFASKAGRWIELPWMPADVAFSHPTPMPTLTSGHVAAPIGFGLAMA